MNLSFDTDTSINDSDCEYKVSSPLSFSEIGSDDELSFVCDNKQETNSDIASMKHILLRDV